MSTAPRELLAIGIIGITLCLGVQWAVLEPARRAASVAFDESARAREALLAIEQLPSTMSAIESRRGSLEARADAISQFNTHATDEGRLYSTISSLAESAGVRIDRLDAQADSSVKSSLNGSATVSGADKPVTPEDRNVRYDIIALGAYDAIALFIDGLQHDVGYCIVRSAHLEPAVEDQAKLVRAVIQTEHFAFQASPPSNRVSSIAEPASTHASANTLDGGHR